MRALRNMSDTVLLSTVITACLGLVVAILVLVATGTIDAPQDSSAQQDGAGVTLGTNGRPYIGVGGNLSIDSGSGKLGITSGGITIPLG